MNYIIKHEIDYIVDWVGISGWVNIPPLNEHFTVIVNDSMNNLSVLKRIESTKK